MGATQIFRGVCQEDQQKPNTVLKPKEIRFFTEIGNGNIVGFLR